MQGMFNDLLPAFIIWAIVLLITIVYLIRGNRIRILRIRVFFRSKNKRKIYRIFKNVLNRIVISALLYLILTIILIFAFYYFAKLVPVEAKMYHVYLYSFFIILPVLNFVGYNFYVNISAKKMELKRKNIEYQQLKQYTEGIEDLTKQLQKYKHNYNNTLLALKGYMDNNDIEGLKNYFNNEILKDSYNGGKKKSLACLHNISNSALKGLLTIKLNKAISEGLNLNISIVDKIEDVHIKTIDLIKVTGILIDNAIESASLSKNKLVSIAFIKEDDGVVLVIGNSYERQPDLENIFKEGFSTKGNNRGFGLSSVVDILDNYEKRTELHTFINKGMLFQELYFKY